MNDETRGQTWPLKLIFVLTLAGGIIGVVAKSLGYTFDASVIVILLIVAALTCLILYLPPLYLMSKVLTAGAVTTRIDQIWAALIGAPGNANPGQLVALSTAIPALGTQLTALNARFNAAPAAGDVRQEIQSIRDILTRIDNQVSATGPVLVEIQAVKRAVALIDARFNDAGDVAEEIKTITDVLNTIKPKSG